MADYQEIEDEYLSHLDWLWRERGFDDQDRIYAMFASFLPLLQSLAPAPDADTDYSEALHWIERYAAGIDSQCQMDKVAEAIRQAKEPK